MQFYQNLSTMTAVTGNHYYVHYMQYLQSIALQLFKWEGLPLSIDERSLEMMLHYQGVCAVVNHPDLGLVASQGAPQGMLDIYGRPSVYNCVFPNNSVNIKARVFNYLNDQLPDGLNYNLPDCILAYNNDFGTPTSPSLRMFAEDLAHIKQVTRINVNNQKTPYINYSNDKNILSMKKLEQQIDSGISTVYVNEKLNPDSIKQIVTPAPYVADKLNEHLAFVWNEVMTYLGIANNNQLKKERMVVDEVNKNDEQTTASENILLKAREEAAERMNALWGLNVKVKIRTETLEDLEKIIEKEVN